MEQEKDKKTAEIKLERMKTYIHEKIKWDISVTIESEGRETVDPVVFYR